MPYKNKEQRLQYGKTYMNKKRATDKVIPIVIPKIISSVIPIVIPEIISNIVPNVVPKVVPEVILSSIEFNHNHIKWVRRLLKVHREFYKSAWFARWKYDIYKSHQIIINS